MNSNINKEFFNRNLKINYKYYLLKFYFPLIVITQLSNYSNFFDEKDDIIFFNNSLLI